MCISTGKNMGFKIFKESMGVEFFEKKMAKADEVKNFFIEFSSKFHNQYSFCLGNAIANVTLIIHNRHHRYQN